MGGGGGCGLGEKEIHFVLVPFMAQGHMIPMVDLAFLLAQRGMPVTVVTTPRNASRFQTAIDRSKESSLPIEFLALSFPSTEAGLPEGCENIDTLPCSELGKSFFAAARLLEDPLRLHLQNHRRRQVPTCIVSDFCNQWSRRVSRQLGIPWLVFYSVCCFTQYCFRTLLDFYKRENVTDESKLVAVPGILHRIEVTKKQAPGWFPNNKNEEMAKEWEEGEAAADGFVVNSFAELEPAYVDLYQKAHGRKVWTIGPLSLRNREMVDMASRGSKPAVDENKILLWLDSMAPRSVTYVSFGSLARTTPAQAVEIGLGLEASGHLFLWVIRAEEGEMGEIEAWLGGEGGFEERNRGRGFVIRGWAPQVLILSHPSVGGFLTHCGWNSTLEAITAGVPVATWPCFGDQFLNERFLLDVVGCGVAVGSKVPYYWWDKDVMVRREQVEEAVRRLMMDEADDAERRRRRASELGERARRAVEVGGSSHVNMTALIEDVRRLAVRLRYEENGGNHHSS